MVKLLIYYFFIICCGFLLLPQSISGLRIKRSDSLANATVKLAEPTPLIKNVTSTEVDKAAKANVIPVPVPVPFTAPVLIAEELQPAKKLELLEESPFDFADRLQRPKRRMSFIDDSQLPKVGHHGHHRNGGAAPPYVYFNKMISPDGKQELKEFQLMAPNVVIESLQHDMNYGPMADMGGVLLLNSDNNLNLDGRMHGLAKSNHHHKQKSSLALPPFLYLLQQMLQPNLNLPMERNRIDTPIYQFLDNAVDNGLHNNHEMIERERENDIDFPSQKIELNKEEKSKEINGLLPNRKDDELIVSCPIHHEHIAGNNGETIDDDVVLVNECHVV